MAFYTAYIILHGPKKQNLSDLEHWILHKAPLVKATRERFAIFNQQIQKYLTHDMTLASIPCGLMDDLLQQDYTKLKNVHLVGIDIDPESLNFASEKAKDSSCQNVLFTKKDAWNLDADGQYHLIVSNGLNIYEPEDIKVIQLYQEFYRALKIGGRLITSFVTPSPAMTSESTWCHYNADDLLKQRALFSDVIGVSWQKYRTESETQIQLEKAGFKIVEIIYDTQGMFPTIVSQK
ncbi:MAG: class I SAM-dependent methyltransferase [Janthinobacterium lividum]